MKMMELFAPVLALFGLQHLQPDDLEPNYHLRGAALGGSTSATSPADVTASAANRFDVSTLTPQHQI